MGRSLVRRPARQQDSGSLRRYRDKDGALTWDNARTAAEHMRSRQIRGHDGRTV